MYTAWAANGHAHARGRGEDNDVDEGMADADKLPEVGRSNSRAVKENRVKVWPATYDSPRRRMPFNSIILPARYCSPRQRMPLNSSIQASNACR